MNNSPRDLSQFNCHVVFGVMLLWPKWRSYWWRILWRRHIQKQLTIVRKTLQNNNGMTTHAHTSHDFTYTFDLKTNLDYRVRTLSVSVLVGAYCNTQISAPLVLFGSFNLLSLHGAQFKFNLQCNNKMHAQKCSIV